MVSRGALVLSFHGLVWSIAIAFAMWATGVHGASAARYDTATPHTPPYTKYKYIPVSSSYNSQDTAVAAAPAASVQSTGLAPSELILTALRTALDVVRNINKSRAQPRQTARNRDTSIRARESSVNATETGRGFYDDHHETTTTTAKPMKQGRYTDPWAGYYDWIINEGSFKFWSVFQLFTAALLLYACFSAIYYAKFNPVIPDYDREYDDYFLERTVGRQARSLDPEELPSGLTWINPRTFQFILDAIATHYQ